MSNLGRDLLLGYKKTKVDYLYFTRKTRQLVAKASGAKMVELCRENVKDTLRVKIGKRVSGFGRFTGMEHSEERKFMCDRISRLLCLRSD